MTKSNYYCFSEKGEVLLPNDLEINNSIQKGVRPIIFIDSCVCLEIIKLVDYGKKATDINKEKILNLKEYIHKNNIELSPLFGIMELCSRKEIFDVQKFWDFKHRIDFFLLIPFKNLKQMNYDFKRDYIKFKDDNLSLGNPYSEIKSIQFNTYSSLLKIRLIAKESLLKKDFEKNCNILIDWMINDLKIFFGVECKLGFSIFGGNTEFRKMLGIDLNSEKVKKILLGTTWDIFHSRISTNSSMISNILGENLKPFFLTNDKNLFNLFKSLELSMIIDGGENFGSSFIFNTGIDYPNFDEKVTERLNVKMITLLSERFKNKYIFEEKYVLNLIEELEIKNNIA
ncbi:hypothetical protein NTJ12_002573, partial [Flavobacterium psychrophilum]|nr:hypothetical protein [Flavobacterium psychrophilum]